MASEALTAASRAELRMLLDAAFEGDFTDDDWNHALGGLHVWLTGANRVISHASVVERTLVCSGRRLQVGYVEAVATAESDRRKGYGSTVMKRVSELIGERYVLGALSTGTPELYERLGWERWRGPTFVDSPSGRVRTPEDDGGVMVLHTRQSPDLDLDGDIACDWRPGDVW